MKKAIIAFLVAIVAVIVFHFTAHSQGSVNSVINTTPTIFDTTPSKRDTVVIVEKALKDTQSMKVYVEVADGTIRRYYGYQIVDYNYREDIKTVTKISKRETYIYLETAKKGQYQTVLVNDDIVFAIKPWTPPVQKTKPETVTNPKK